jgi:DNA invertase Pin-like site-specific DNA recombinase
MASSKHRTRRTKARSDAVIGYVRCSTAEQADSGLGLAAQRATIAAEATRRDVTVTRVYEDAGMSGKSLAGRPALAEALDALAAGQASVLVVAKLDRLARSVADFAGLVRRAEAEGWAILACDLGVDMTSPTGGLLANVTASVAEWERRIIATRTREALAAKRAAGVRLGRPRLLAPAVAARIRSERSAGATLAAIAGRLNAEAVTTPSGRPWSPALVRKVALQDPADQGRVA